MGGQGVEDGGVQGDGESGSERGSQSPISQNSRKRLLSPTLDFARGYSLEAVGSFRNQIEAKSRRLMWNHSPWSSA